MLLIRCLLLSICFLSSSIALAEKKDDNQVYYKKFQEVFEKVDREYVQEPDKQKMLDAALNGMLMSLDPHSMYFTPEEYEDMIAYTKGEFGGIGVEISFEKGAIKIISPIDDLAAYKAGITSGDYIISVNDESVADLGFNKSVKKLRGEPGTKVKISVIRDGENKPRDYELVRELVKIKAVKFSLDGEVAYIRIVTFNEHTTAELKKAMKTIIADSKKPLKGIILDLRNNGGGLFDQAISVSEYFIDTGVIVTTKGRTGASHASFSSSKFVSKAPDLPMVILINGGSASSSEIVAGALQDHKRAVLLGTQSFGKGSVQTLMPIHGSSGVKMTTAKYYTPSGRSIQADGIEPDILVEQAKVEYPVHPEDEKKFSESAYKNHLKNDDKSETTEKKDKDAAKTSSEEEKPKRAQSEMSDMYKKDYQYSRAYDLILGIFLSESYKKAK